MTILDSVHTFSTLVLKAICTALLQLLERLITLLIHLGFVSKENGKMGRTEIVQVSLTGGIRVHAEECRKDLERGVIVNLSLRALLTV